jgi:hypothetical protein
MGHSLSFYISLDLEKGEENAQTRNYQENREIRQLVLTLLQISHGQSISFDIFIGENINLVYEVVPDVHFSYKLANREFWIIKLPRESVLITS